MRYVNKDHVVTIIAESQSITFLTCNMRRFNHYYYERLTQVTTVQLQHSRFEKGFIFAGII